MPNTIVGTILEIGATQQVPTKNGNAFQKRTLVLDASTYDQYTGDKRDNFPSFTFMQKHCADLDAYQAGQRVAVSFIVSGNRYEKDGQVRWFNNIVGYKIEPFAPNQYDYNQQAQQVPHSSQSPSPYQPPTQRAQASQNVSNASQTEENPFPPASNESADDLHFSYDGR